MPLVRVGAVFNIALSSTRGFKPLVAMIPILLLGIFFLSSFFANAFVTNVHRFFFNVHENLPTNAETALTVVSCGSLHWSSSLCLFHMPTSCSPYDFYHYHHSLMVAHGAGVDVRSVRVPSGFTIAYETVRWVSEPPVQADWSHSGRVSSACGRRGELLPNGDGPRFMSAVRLLWTDNNNNNNNSSVN